MRSRHPRFPAVVLLFLLASGCQQANPSATPGTASGATAVPGSSQGAPGSQPPAAADTSEDLIAAALAAGTITYEESLIDRALALFNSPGLPEAFRGGPSNLDAGTSLFADIEAAGSTLSSDTMAKLAPYLARPSDPTSIFSKPTTARGTGVVLAADTTVGWKSVTAADGAARVWVPDSVAADNHLHQHAADVSKVWAAYEDVFTYPDPDAPGIPNATVNPDAAVDFYFIEARDLDPRRPDCSDPAVAECSLVSLSAAGFARAADARRANASSAYFVLDAGAGGDAALFKLAHEIAHGGQFHYDNHEASWLSESTANWVAYRVFEKLGIPPEPAYGWLPAFFANPSTSLTSEGDMWSYRAWLYFQFAAMQRGDSIVAAIWANAGSPGAQGAQAVDAVFPFADHFADFSVRNWNQDPVPNRYRSAPDPTFPELEPSIRRDTPALKPGAPVDLNVALPSLATAYFTFGFDDATRKITFDNRLAGLDGAHVWAIRQIAGVWHEPEDWSGAAKKEFCRDTEAGNLSKLVLVVSWAKVSGSLRAADGTPTVTGSASGCGDWKGTMKATATWTTPDDHGTGSASFDGIWSLDSDYTLQCEINETPCTGYLPSGTITWDWHAVNIVNGGIICQEDKGGTVEAGHVREVVTQRFVLTQTADPTKLTYSAAGGFDIPEKLKCTDISSGAGLGTYAYVPDHRSPGDVGAYGDTCDYTTWEIEATATTISGSCYQWNTSAHSLKFEWNLTRIGPPPG